MFRAIELCRLTEEGSEEKQRHVLFKQEFGKIRLLVQKKSDFSFS